MSIAYNTSIVRDGLVLYLDAANIKSYPGILGSELVTNSIVTQIDGTTFNVVRDGVQNIALTLCSVEAGKTYYIDYFIPTYTGTISATFRINNGGGNLTPTVTITSTGRFNAKFTANISGTLSINGDNTGTNLLVDYVSVREVLSGTGQTWFDLSGRNNVSTLTNRPTYDTNNNGSIVLDGIDDYVSIACPSNTIRAYNSTTQFVVKLPTWNVGQRNIISYRNAGSLYIGAGSGGVFCYYNTLSPNPAFYIGSIPNNVVAHVAVTCDATNNLLSTYINGSLAGSVSRTGWSTAYNTTMTIGGSDIEYMVGNFYSFSHYDRVLSANEILQNFNAIRGRYNV